MGGRPDCVYARSLHREQRQSALKSPVRYLFESDASSDDDDDDSYCHHQVTHDTSSFYWHGSSPSDYRDPFEEVSKQTSNEYHRTPRGKDHIQRLGCPGTVERRPVLEMSVKVIIIGDPGVGKTSLIQRYINQKYTDNYKWTIGVDFALKLIRWSDDINIKLQLWDIAGQERFKSMTRVYYRDAHACVIMFDLTQRGSFLNALKWKNDLDQKCQLPDGSPVPCLLLANKCDLHEREVGQTEIEALSREQNFLGWTEISVKLDLMVDESMKFLIGDIVTRCTEVKSDTDPDISIVRLTEKKSGDLTDKCTC